MNHIKMLREMIEREVKLQIKSITAIKKEYHQENIVTLSHAIKCCEMVEKFPKVCPYCKSDLTKRPLGNPDKGYGGEVKC